MTVNGSNQITLSLGQTTVCTITNDDTAPTLTLVKSVTTTGDPAEVPPTGTEWTLQAAGDQTISGASGSGAVTGATVNAGSYTLSESGGPAHYAQSGGWNCSGVSGQGGSSITLAPGDTATCTVTNVYVPPGTIVIEKSAVGGNETFSFSGDLGEFSIPTTGGGGSRTFSDLNPATYSVTEGTQPSGWTATSATCTDGDVSYSPSSISLASGATVVCTFTDTKKGRIIVEKTTDPTGEEQSFDFTTNYGDGFSLSDGGQNDSGYTVTPNSSHSVSESVPEGWVKLSATCDNGDSPSEVSPAPGQTVTCAFVNGKLPVLTIIKDVHDGEGSFNFNVTPEEGAPQHVNLYNNAGTHLSQSVFLGAGTYDVTEDAQGGWQLAHVSCVYGEQSVGSSIAGGESITVDYGDHVTCTFINTQKSIIYVNKTVTNDNNGHATASDFSFKVDGEEPVSFNSDGHNYVIVEQGVHSVTEVAADGYTSSLGDNCTEVELGAAEHTTCAIVNNDVVPATPSQTTTTSDIGANGPPVGAGGIGFFGSVLGASTTTVPSGGAVLGASTSTSPSQCTALITQIPLAEGLQNDSAQVKALQGFLNGEVNAGLPTTGFFGPLTKVAVNTFQLKYWQDVLAPWVPFGLPTDHTPTGWVGKTTAWKVNMISCPSLNLSAPALP